MNFDNLKFQRGVRGIFVMIQLTALLNVRTFWLQAHLWLHKVISSLPYYSKELYVMERNDYVSSILSVTVLYLIFSKNSTSQLLTTTLKSNLTCIFLSVRGKLLCPVHYGTRCNNQKTPQNFIPSFLFIRYVRVLDYTNFKTCSYIGI